MEEERDRGKPGPRQRANPYLETMLHLAWETGLRRGDICAIHLGDLDLEGGYVTIGEEDEKTGKRKRVALNERVVAVIGGYLLWTEITEGWLFPSPRRPSEHVEPDLVGKWFAKAKRLAGVEEPGLGFHSYRRTVATKLADKGASPAKMAKAMGWSDERMALTYQQAEQVAADEALRSVHDD